MRKFIDLSGQRFGKYKVIEICKIKESKIHDSLFHCLCDCGKADIVTSSGLRKRSIASCKECKFKYSKYNIKNKKFGHYLVLEEDEIKTKKYGNKYWWCKCEFCGKIKSVSGSALTKKNVK